MPILLPLTAPVWEQDVAEGPGCPSHCSGKPQRAGAMGKQEARFLPRPSGLTRFSKQRPLPGTKYIENFEAERTCPPHKLYFTYGMHTGHSHCQISSVFCE